MSKDLTGFLALEDERRPGSLIRVKERIDLIDVAERAMRLAELGLVHLVQRRIGDDTFSYLAIARSRPAGVALSFSTLFAQEAA